MGDTPWSGRDEFSIAQPQNPIATAGELQIVRDQNACQGMLSM